MKKITAMLLVVCLLLAVCPMAMAMEAKTLDGYYLGLIRSNVIILHENGADLCKLDGTVLKHYDEDVSFADGINTVTPVSDATGLSGLVRLDGVEIMPMAYAQVNADTIWAIGVKYTPGTEEEHDSMFFNGKEMVPVNYAGIDIYNIPDAACVASLSVEEASEWCAMDEFLNIEDADGVIHCYDASFQEVDAEIESVYDFDYTGKLCTASFDDDSWLYALVSPDGTVLTETIYSYIDIPNRPQPYFEVESEDDMTGLISATGELVVPMEYDEILTAWVNWSTPDVYETVGVFAAKVDDTVTLIDTVNGTVLDVDCSEADDVEFLGTCLMLEQGEELILIAPDGSETRFSAELNDLDSWIMPYGTYFSYYSEDYSEECLISSSGELLLQVADLGILTSDGHVVTFDGDCTVIYTLN